MQTNKRANPLKKPRKTAPVRNGSTPPKSPRTEKRDSGRVTQVLADALIQQARGASLDRALTTVLRNAQDLKPDQRRSVVLDLYAINRHRSRLGWHLDQLKAEQTPAGLLSAWLAFTSKGQAWTDESGVEDLHLMRRVASRTMQDPAMPETVRLECPPTYEPLLREALGSSFARELATTLEPPRVDLRVNLLKGSKQEAIKRLHWDKVEATPAPISPWGLICEPGTNVSSTRAFQDGLVEFQDEGSQLAALLCDALPGMQVMDFCSGTGGKALALAATMQNRGHLVACDVSAVRLARSKLRLKRAGVENAERIELPAVDNKAMKKFHGKFHRVLVDAPCSGTGSWRRNPDVRWSSHAANIAELTALQSAILDRAAHYVQKDGHLIYATCSLLREENDQRVDTFLQIHPDFEQVDARQVWARVSDKPWPCGDEKVLRLSPAIHGTDGFFAAILRKATIPA